MLQLLGGMSPHSGLSQVPRLRAETHFGVQARALPVGLHYLIKRRCILRMAKGKKMKLKSRR